MFFIRYLDSVAPRKLFFLADFLIILSQLSALIFLTVPEISAIYFLFRVIWVEKYLLLDCYGVCQWNKPQPMHHLHQAYDLQEVLQYPGNLCSSDATVGIFSSFDFWNHRRRCQRRWGVRTRFHLMATSTDHPGDTPFTNAALQIQVYH